MAEPIKKTDIVKALVADGDMKKALSIAKDFRLGISKQDSSDMRRGYECMVTSPAFYRSIGLDVEECVKRGIEVLVRLYGEKS